MWKIPLFDLSFDEQEKAAVNQVLESKWLTSGPKTKEFENKFEEFLGEDTHASAVANGTAALHIALLQLNLKEKDEIIISGLSFVAALNVVTLCNAIPVLADSKSLDDWNVSTEDIRSKITQHTRAIIVVHYAGYPCDMDDLIALCKQNNLILIEDAAHAVGARYKGQFCGTFGDLGCFSFFSNKNLSVGEGGMITTQSPDRYKKNNLFRSHGMTSLTVERHAGRTISYDVLQPGLNYRLDEIRSAMGLVQLAKLKNNNNKRRKLVEYYIQKFRSNNNILIPWRHLSSEIEPSYHIFPVLIPESANRISIINFLKEKGIQTSIHYPSYYDFAYYKKRLKGDLPIANQISRRIITLPLYPDLNFKDIDYIVDSIKDCFQKTEANK